MIGKSWEVPEEDMWSAGACRNILASAFTVVLLALVSLVFFCLLLSPTSARFYTWKEKKRCHRTSNGSTHLILLLQCKKNSLETQMHFSAAVSWIQTKSQEKSKTPPRPLSRRDAAAALRPFSGIPGGAGDAVRPSARPSLRPPALLIFHAPAGTEHVQSRARFVGPLCTCLVSF